MKIIFYVFIVLVVISIPFCVATKKNGTYRTSNGNVLDCKYAYMSECGLNLVFCGKNNKGYDCQSRVEYLGEDDK